MISQFINRRFFSTTTTIMWLLSLAGFGVAATSCRRTSIQHDRWVVASVDTLVRAAWAAYESEDRLLAYQRIVNHIAGEMKQCNMATDREFNDRYPEFVEYLRLLSLATRDDHELGFEVSDKEYFAETSQYTTIPDFLLTPRFLRSVSRFETLSQAK